jgi:hypothetical protein
MKVFEVGQWIRLAPASRHAVLFAVGQVDRVAVERALAQQPLRLVGVEIVARLREKLDLTQATSSVCSERCVCIRQSGCSRQSAPIAISCSGVEVGEKRGVMT